MAEDGESIGPDEHVLRRVHKSQINRGSLTRGAFTPNLQDTDGLSVYRELIAGGSSVSQLKQASGKSPDDYVVVWIAVRDLNSLGLSVVVKNDPDGPPGHCVIPEFTIGAYQDRKQKEEKWVPIQQELVRLAKPADC